MMISEGAFFLALVRFPPVGLVESFIVHVMTTRWQGFTSTRALGGISEE